MADKKNILKENLSRQLKQVRKELNVSQEEMGRVLGLKRSGYGKMERGDTLPGARVLFILSSKYGVSIDALLSGRGVLFKKKKGAGVPNGSVGEEAELIALMRRVPLVRHSVMGHFQRFKLENRDIIDAELEKTKTQS